MEPHTPADRASLARRLPVIPSLVAAALLHAPTLAAQTPPAGPMARARYSLPWNLRPAIAPNLLRVDLALAFSAGGLNTATIATGGGRPFGAAPDLGFYGRVGAVTYGPDGSPGHSTFANPLVFGLWTPQLAAGLRLPVFVGVTIPVGAGADASGLQRTTFASGAYTRQAMDNALFAGNFLTVTAGAGVAFIRSGFTAQAEFTVLQLTRVWGETVDPDSSRTNFTTGAHVGYQLLPWLTASVEAHYQHWLSTPTAVSRNEALRAQFTLGGGLRTNLPVGAALLRPGVAFFMPVGGPMATADTKVLQFDLAAAF